mgnify:CR=1 FL=1
MRRLGLTSLHIASIGLAAQKAADTLREMGEAICEPVRQSEFKFSKMHYAPKREPEKWQGSGKRGKPKLR